MRIEMIYIIIVIVLFFADFLCKRYVETHLEMKKNYPVLKGRIIFSRYHNKGATLNFMDKYPKVVRMVSVVVIILIGAIFCILLRTKGNHMLKTGLALILGGGFCNTYDRLKKGYVVDYLQFGVKWEPLRRVVFNISDFFIIIGAVLSAF